MQSVARTVDRTRLTCGTCGAIFQAAHNDGPIPKACAPCAAIRDRKARDEAAKRYAARLVAANTERRPRNCAVCGVGLPEYQGGRTGRPPVVCQSCAPVHYIRGGNVRARRSYRKNRDRNVARVVAWRRANTDWVREYDRLWRSVNGKNAEYNHVRRARLQGAVHIPFTRAQLAAKLAYWGDQCWICQGPMQAVDHVKPLAAGGPHCLANLRPICTSCNSRKRSNWPYAIPEQRP